MKALQKQHRNYVLELKKNLTLHQDLPIPPYLYIAFI